MKILFLTFNQGHLVSDREFDALKTGFAKVGLELLRNQAEDYDVVLVKGWSHTWEQVKEKNTRNRKVVYLSIGTEWKLNTDLKELNQPIEDLYSYADAVVHISQYCQTSHHTVLGKRLDGKEKVILIAREPQLPKTLKPLGSPLRLATTCIPRPVKRLDELEALCKLHGVDLVPAYGSVSDFGYYHDCDGWISLSRKEGMCNAGLEALAYGLPLIMTNYGGNRELVGNSGVVIENDPDNVPWDPTNIEPVDEVLFEQALLTFRNTYYDLKRKVRERVNTQLNDYVTACKFKQVFQSCV